MTALAALLALGLGGPLWTLALVFLVGLPVGLGLLALAGDPWLTPARLRRAATTQVRAARDGVVTIRGRVAPGESGVVMSPVSARPIVWARIDYVQYRLSQSGDLTPEIVWSEMMERDFLVDDGSGEPAHVSPSGARVLGDEILGFTVDATGATVGSYLEAHGLSQLEPNVNEHFLVERALLPGSEVIVRGPAVRRSPAAGSQARAGAQLCFEASARRGADLLISPWPVSSLGLPPLALIAGLLCMIASLAPLGVTVWWRLGLGH